MKKKAKKPAKKVAKKKTATKKTAKKKAFAPKPPQTLDGGKLGTLKLTAVLSEYVEYSTDCKLGRNTIELVLYSVKNDCEMTPAIEAAAQLQKDFRQVKTRLDAYLTDVVYPQVNQFWRPDKPMTLAKFRKDVRLEEICVHDDGKASFAYDSEEAFLGHALVLYGTSEGTIRDHDTPG